MTVLFNQLGGLQIINPDSNEWKYVKPQPGSAIINLGDAIVKLVGDRLRSAVHRVIGPPGAQAQSPRHSVVYFSRPNGAIKLASLLDDEDKENAMTADEWIANRVKLRRTANYQGEDTFNASRGTEHLKERGKATLDRPSKVCYFEARNILAGRNECSRYMLILSVIVGRRTCLKHIRH